MTTPGSDKRSRRSFRRILVGITAGEKPNPGPALRYGAFLAKDQNAELAVHVLPPQLDPPRPWSGTSASSFLQTARQRCDALIHEAISQAGHFVGSMDISPSFSRTGDIFEARAAGLTKMARVCDVTILDAPRRKSPARATIERTLLDGGGPVISVPSGSHHSGNTRMAIAWDGSPQAARAARDALPLLVRAQSVEIITVMSRKDLSRMAPGMDLANFLAAHEIATCQLDTLVTTPDANAAGRLLRRLEDMQPDLVVMGAYVHSRLREAVFGGVTRSLLDCRRFPLFLCH